MITADLFQARVGRPPEDDDLQRCNCAEAGQIGHFLCGWDEEHDLPRFITGNIYVSGRAPAPKGGALGFLTMLRPPKDHD